MAYTIPPSWAVKQTVPLAKLATFTSDLTFLGTPPCGEASSGGTTQSLASGASFTQITTMTSVFAVGSIVFASNHFTLPAAGRYYVSGAVSFATALVGGAYQAQLHQNSTAVATGSKPGISFSGGAPVISPVRYFVVANVNDTISLFASQTAGSSRPVSGRLFVKWISN